MPGPQRRQRESLAERRQRHAAIDDLDTIVNAAGRYLEVRSRSVQEVRRHLVQAGYRADLVEAAVTRLLDLGMLNDESFARLWVESRDRARPRSSSALRRELAVKGIDRELAAEVLAERQQAAEEEAEGSADVRAATRLLNQKRSALERLPDLRVRRQRAYSLLARNGFTPDACREAIEAAAFLHPDAGASADSPFEVDVNTD